MTHIPVYKRALWGDAERGVPFPRRRPETGHGQLGLPLGAQAALSGGRTSGLLAMVAFQGQLQPAGTLEYHQLTGHVAPSHLGSSRGLGMVLIHLGPLSPPTTGGPGNMVAMQIVLEI